MDWTLSLYQARIYLCHYHGGDLHNWYSGCPYSFSISMCIIICIYSPSQIMVCVNTVITTSYDDLTSYQSIGRK